MSARQRARILNQAALLGISSTNNESEDDAESEASNKGPAIARDRFCFDSSESSDNSECSSEEELEVTINMNVTIDHQKDAKLSAPLKSNKEEDIQAELEFLDAAISQQTQSEEHSELNVYSVHNKLFSFENSYLDINEAMRRRAGEHGTGNPPRQQHHRAGDMRRRHGGRGLRHIGPTSKKYVFGPPSEDWPKPPSFAAGGVGMSRLSSAAHAVKGKAAAPVLKTDGGEWYAFEWSQEYLFLCAQFQYIESAGDANLLVMFLTHFPYFHRGLFHLAVLYARLGQLEKAVELSRRALFVFDYASLESFRSAVLGGKGSSCVCRMDPAASECNQDYFAAMALHMRICNALGHHAVAAEVGRYALSLNPAAHAPGLLLGLDRLLVAADKHDVMLEFCSITPPTCIGSNSASIKDLREFQFHSPLRFDLYPVHLTDVTVPEHHPPETPGVSSAFPLSDHRSLEHLPNWWFSLALSAFQQERQQRGRMAYSAANTAPTPSVDACFLLKAALLRWPFMLAGLLAGTPSLKASDIVPSLLAHPLFSADARLPRSNSYLSTICRVYAARAGSLWHKEEVRRWLVQCASELRVAVDALGSDGTTSLLGELEHLYTELHRNTSINAVLSQFSTVLPEPYAEGFPPIGESPLYPGLDDPEYLLSGAVRFQNFMNPEGEYMFAVPREYASTLRRRRRGRRSDRQRDRGDEESDYSDSDHDESWAEQMLRLLRPRGRPGDDGNEGRPHQLAHIYWHGERGGMEFAAHNTAQSNIDLSLPLMQLFLSTLFPWIFVRPLPRA